MSPPTELLYAIISNAWESPLMPLERIHFMISSKLVSHTWAAVFDDISGADVHVPCESFYHHYFSDDSGSSDYPRCQRITFTVYDPDRQRALAHPYTRTLSYMRHAHVAQLTALRCMRIVFHDSIFPDPYAQGFFSALPAYLPTLAVSYTFSHDLPTSLIEHYRRRFERTSEVRYAAPRVGTLAVDGADEFIAAVWESLFPGRQRLVRDGEERERLMNVSSVFSTYKALWVRLEDAQRQRRREEAVATVLPPALDRHRQLHRIKVVDGDGERTFVTATTTTTTTTTTNPAHAYVHSLHFRARTTRVGDVGYLNSSSEFVPLFNALEPHVVPSSSSSSMMIIPSLSGYGDARVRSRLSRRCKRESEGGVALMGRFARAVLGLRNTMMDEEYMDASENGVAFKWFQATVASVVEAYGKVYGFHVEDVVLLLSSPRVKS